MSEPLTRPQLLSLGAKRGASSHVTRREVVDGQLTLDAIEKEVLHCRVAPSQVWRGAIREVPESSLLRAPVYRGTAEIGRLPLRINYPKDHGDEIRIYFRRDGFSPAASDRWYIFIRADGELCIGWASEAEFQALSVEAKGALVDDEDSDYQSRVESYGAVPSVRSVPADRYSREAKYGFEALERAGYQCEVDPSHASFVSARTRRQYMECHHIVPVFAVRDFPGSTLDSPQNIASLCPNCHRKIHYGVESERLEMAKALLHRRPQLLNWLQIPEDRALAYYQGPTAVPER